MGTSGPYARLQLIQEYKPRANGQAVDIADLQSRLSLLPGFDQVEIEAGTPSMVVARVPARNKRETDRLKALVNDKLEGWSVLEEQRYSLPNTF